MKFFAGRMSALLFSLSSCDTMSEDQCKKANWLDIGRTEGSQGLSLSRVAEHNKACSKYGIKANSAEYKKGYQEANLQEATKDCAEPKSSIHSHGAGHWTAYPR